MCFRLFLIVYPRLPCCIPLQIDERIEAFKASSAALDEGIDKVFHVSVDTTKKMQIHFKNHYRSVGRAFQSLSNAFGDTQNRNGSAELRVLTLLCRILRKTQTRTNPDPDPDPDSDPYMVHSIFSLSFLSSKKTYIFFLTFSLD